MVDKKLARAVSEYNAKAESWEVFKRKPLSRRHPRRRIHTATAANICGGK